MKPILKGHRPAARSRQSGAVLVIAMIMLLVLTLLGVTAMNTTSMQERMAANSQELTRAFQAAETGLWSAVLNIQNLYLVNTNNTTTGYSDALSSGNGKSAGAFYATAYLYCGKPHRGPNASSGNVSSNYYFDSRSDGYSRVTDVSGTTITGTTTPSGASEVVVHGGFYVEGGKCSSQ
jgi:Tfp pilus assembly protein PilX